MQSPALEPSPNGIASGDGDGGEDGPYGEAVGKRGREAEQRKDDKLRQDREDVAHSG
jgi:hypothetical protein